MNCQNEDIIRFFYKETSGEETEQIKSHLQECPCCQAFYYNLEDLFLTWKRQEKPVLSEEFSGKIKRKLYQELDEQKTIGFPWSRFLIAAAILFSLVLSWPLLKFDQKTTLPSFPIVKTQGKTFIFSGEIDQLRKNVRKVKQTEYRFMQRYFKKPSFHKSIVSLQKKTKRFHKKLESPLF